MSNNHSSILRQCAAPGCVPSVIVGRGLCMKHYHLFRFSGQLENYPLGKKQSPGIVLTKKTCNKCNIEKPIESFSLNGTEQYPSRRNSICNACKYPSTKRQGLRRLNTTAGRSTDLLMNAKVRAANKGLICTLTATWVEEKLIAGCEMTGLPFDLETGKSIGRFNPYGPSIDRIVPGSNYTPENCRMVIMAINVAMNAWGEEFYRKIATAHFKHRRTKNKERKKKSHQSTYELLLDNPPSTVARKH